jgi:hypothetical protein
MRQEYYKYIYYDIKFVLFFYAIILKMIYITSRVMYIIYKNVSRNYERTRRRSH